MADRDSDLKDAQVLTEDVDDTSNQTPVKGETLEVKSLGVEDFVPSDSDKSFGTVVATFLVGILLTFLVGKGYLSEGQSAQYAPLLQGVILAGVAAVAHRFIKTRGEVKQAAIRAAANPRGFIGGTLASATLEPARVKSTSPMGGGFSMQSLLFALSSAQMVLAFAPGSKTKKAKVQKAISAALAAISEFQKDPD